MLLFELDLVDSAEELLLEFKHEVKTIKVSIVINVLIFILITHNGLAMCFGGFRSSSLSNLDLAKTLIYINSNYKLTNQRFGGVATKNCG